MTRPKLTKGQHKALAIMAAMPEHLAWHLHSYAKTGVAEGTVKALGEMGLCVFEAYTVKETVRRTGGLRQSIDITWKPRWRARITDAGRALVTSAEAT